MGIQRARRGTAIRASPKPKADRINVARNTIRRILRVVDAIMFEPEKRIGKIPV
jgi:hypothetical protein